jgi:GDP-4-dehydro-6-deoxy-D-mannose reductase
MRALVTGASGFAGRHLVKHLLEKGDNVLATDLGSGQAFKSTDCKFFKDSFISDNLSVISLDVSNFLAVEGVIQEFKPEVIYHLAGISFVPEAEDDFDKTLKINVSAVNNIVRVCHLLENKAKVLFTSSAEVYGRQALNELPLRESTETIPANNYSLSKAMGELVCSRYAQFNKVFPIVIRPFNHIGPVQNTRFVVSSFASQLADIAKGKKEPVLRVGNLEAKRDFSDVRDIVSAYRLAVEKGDCGIYNLCSGKAISIQYILNTLVSISGLDVKIETDASRYREAEVKEIYGSFDKAKDSFGFEPKINIEQSLKDTYQYFLDL